MEWARERERWGRGCDRGGELERWEEDGWRKRHQDMNVGERGWGREGRK